MFFTEQRSLVAESHSIPFWVKHYRRRSSTTHSFIWSKHHIIHPSVPGICNQRARHGDLSDSQRALPALAATRYKSKFFICSFLYSHRVLRPQRVARASSKFTSHQMVPCWNGLRHFWKSAELFTARALKSSAAISSFSIVKTDCVRM